MTRTKPCLYCNEIIIDPKGLICDACEQAEIDEREANRIKAIKAQEECPSGAPHRFALVPNSQGTRNDGVRIVWDCCSSCGFRRARAATQAQRVAELRRIAAMGGARSHRKAIEVSGRRLVA